MSVESPTIREIEHVLQGAILGTGKAESKIRSAFFFNKSDLSEARKFALERLTADDVSSDLNFDKLSIVDLASMIGSQMRMVALSKKEEYCEDTDPDRVALRQEVEKADGFCRKLYALTQDEANQGKVEKALKIVAADLDQDRLDAKIKLHNKSLVEGFWNRDLARIKKQRADAEVGEEILTLNDQQRERVREHMATKRLLEKEQLKEVREIIESEVKKGEATKFTPDEDKPEPENGLFIGLKPDPVLAAIAAAELLNLSAGSSLIMSLDLLANTYGYNPDLVKLFVGAATIGEGLLIPKIVPGSINYLLLRRRYRKLPKSD